MTEEIAGTMNTQPIVNTEVPFKVEAGKMEAGEQPLTEEN